jgi:hypothetical protein
MSNAVSGFLSKFPENSSMIAFNQHRNAVQSKRAALKHARSKSRIWTEFAYPSGELHLVM